MLKKRLGSEAIENKDWELDLNDYYKIPSTLIIPEECKKIGMNAFSGCEMLKEVIIPKGCERIDGCAFSSCKKLEKIEIPESCEKIGNFTFNDCHNLRKVIIPENVKVIGDYAFGGCYNATVILRKPRGEFKLVGEKAFNDVWNVKEEIRN